jgi:ATP synthase protein I
MSSSVFRAARAQALWLVCLPAGLVLVLAFLLWLVNGIVAAYSAMLGGAVWLIPNVYFVYRTFAKLEAPNALLWRFYRAEIGKLILSGFLFILVVNNFIVHMPAFLGGFALAQFVFWLAPLFFIFKR